MALSQDRLIAILRDFIYYRIQIKGKSNCYTVSTIFAANKMFENIKQHLKPASDGKGGTYFGATGSGKTNTMLFLSRLLATHDRDVFQSPTIIILVDREDLSNQTSELLSHLRSILKIIMLKRLKVVLI